MFFIGLIWRFSFDNNNYLVCDRAEKRRADASEMSRLSGGIRPLALNADRRPGKSCAKGVTAPGRAGAFHPAKKRPREAGSSSIQREGD
ncbi:hypothetical protein EDWATA_02576 [Edwardsiella tarda ATCC 23685]|uniref:Uncharacterized protein n=1 Tax=Edwardsiella tarda ATCC 23685 TaxID=500638 RepID=D4F742_EDWTA|nr:hypothetical protein EDWATA_02576 [Edwardsiella tarda ATCC 23685]